MTQATDIFKNACFNTGEVDVPGWSKQPIQIRELSAKQASKVVTLVESEPLKSNVLAIVFGCIDDNGKQMFSESMVEKMLDKLRIQDIATVATAIMELSQVEPMGK
jgi:mannitol-specific phosphotransferase system IIBC component